MRQGASFSLDDPRPIKREAPYTYYLPSEQRLAAIAVGDQVQLLFRSAAPDPKYAVERMWVLVQLVSDDDLAGKLLSEPFDMPGLKRGERVAFQRHHVISVIFADKEKSDRLVEAPQRDYWERCIVDRCVLDDAVPVGFIYREAPGPMPEGDRDQDSGWRIRGDARGVEAKDVDERQTAYVAVGAVLNRDDSWLSLIDEPVGSAFLRNFETGSYDRQND